MVYTVTCKNMIRSLFIGKNITFMAYGKTGAGKTYTMTGLPSEVPGVESESELILRSLFDVFQTTEERKNAECSLKVSFLEVYHEELRDLIDPTSVKELFIHEDASGNINIQNLNEVKAKSYKEAFSVFTKSSRNRKTGLTVVNSASSTSHVIFMVTIEHIDLMSGFIWILFRQSLNKLS